MANSTAAISTILSTADEDDRPRFAVIRLKTESNLLGLFQLLLSNGFGEVAFVKNLNDCNFGGNKSIENGSSISKGAGSLLTTIITNGGMNNNEDCSTAKNTNGQSNGQQSPMSYGTKRKVSDQGGNGRAANMLESSIQKLLDAKRRCSEKVDDKCRTDNAKSNQTRQSPNNFYTNGPIASLLQETFTDQGQQQTYSPKLPLSTFTCPLPPPSQRSPSSSGASGNTTMGSSTKPKNQPPSMDLDCLITDRSKADRSAIEILSVTPSATASIGATRPIVQRQSQSKSSDRSAQPPAPPAKPTGVSSPVTAIASLSALFVECNLCHSKIMATRFSNLTNHVRRHAPTKQFQCVHCDYAHNEIAKVRLHMTNNHSDKKSRPANNITSEMQDEWRQLMRECFPERSKRQKPPRPIPPRDGTDQQGQISMGGQGLPTMVTTTTAAGGTQSVVLTGARDANGKTIILGQQQKTSTKREPDDFDGAAFSALEEEEEDYREQVEDDDQALRFARCEQCYVYVDASMKEHHVRTCHVEHLPASILFSCSICELEDEHRPTIETHVRAEHSDEMEDESDLDMIVRRVESDLSRVIDQYFPPQGLEYAGDNLDEIRRMAEEEEGEHQIGDNSNDGSDGKFKYQQPMDDDQAMMDADGIDSDGDHNDQSIEPIRRSTSRVTTRMSTRSQQSTSMSMEEGDDDQSPDRSIKTRSLKSKK